MEAPEKASQRKILAEFFSDLRKEAYAMSECPPISNKIIEHADLPDAKGTRANSGERFLQWRGAARQIRGLGTAISPMPQRLSVHLAIRRKRQRIAT